MEDKINLKMKFKKFNKLWLENINKVKYLYQDVIINLVNLLINEIQFLFTINIKQPKQIKQAICNIFILIVIPNIYPFVPQNVLIYLIPYIKMNNSDQTAHNENKAISILYKTLLAVITYTTKQKAKAGNNIVQQYDVKSTNVK